MSTADDRPLEDLVRDAALRFGWLSDSVLVEQTRLTSPVLQHRRPLFLDPVRVLPLSSCKRPDTVLTTAAKKKNHFNDKENRPQQQPHRSPSGELDGGHDHTGSAKSRKKTPQQGSQKEEKEEEEDDDDDDDDDTSDGLNDADAAFEGFFAGQSTLDVDDDGEYSDGGTDRPLDDELIQLCERLQLDQSHSDAQCIESAEAAEQEETQETQETQCAIIKFHDEMWLSAVDQLEDDNGNDHDEEDEDIAEEGNEEHATDLNLSGVLGHSFLDMSNGFGFDDAPTSSRQCLLASSDEEAEEEDEKDDDNEEEDDGDDEEEDDGDKEEEDEDDSDVSACSEEDPKDPKTQPNETSLSLSMNAEIYLDHASAEFTSAGRPSSPRQSQLLLDSDDECDKEAGIGTKKKLTKTTLPTRVRSSRPMSRQRRRLLLDSESEEEPEEEEEQCSHDPTDTGICLADALDGSTLAEEDCELPIEEESKVSASPCIVSSSPINRRRPRRSVAQNSSVLNALDQIRARKNHVGLQKHNHRKTGTVPVDPWSSQASVLDDEDQEDEIDSALAEELSGEFDDFICDDDEVEFYSSVEEEDEEENEEHLQEVSSKNQHRRRTFLYSSDQEETYENDEDEDDSLLNKTLDYVREQMNTLRLETDQTRVKSPAVFLNKSLCELAEEGSLPPQVPLRGSSTDSTSNQVLVNLSDEEDELEPIKRKTTAKKLPSAEEHTSHTNKKSHRSASPQCHRKHTSALNSVSQRIRQQTILDRRASLGIAVPVKAYEHKKDFRRHREQIATQLFAEFNEQIFDGRLPVMPVLWSPRMLKTAGFCYYGPNRRIVLSTKVIDSYERLCETLSHEMCHAAVEYLDGLRKSTAHGPAWKRWTRRAMVVYSDLQISTRHSYDIEAKFHYVCSTKGCPVVVKRHSKSFDTDRFRCGRCLSPLVLRVMGQDGKVQKPRKASAFSLFVKANFKSLRARHPSLTHGQLMSKLSAAWREQQAASTATVSPSPNGSCSSSPTLKHSSPSQTILID